MRFQLSFILLVASSSSSPLQCGICPDCSNTCTAYAGDEVSLKCQDETSAGLPKFFSEDSVKTRIKDKNFTSQFERGVFPARPLTSSAQPSDVTDLVVECILNKKRKWEDINLKIHPKPEMKMSALPHMLVSGETLKIICTTSGDLSSDSFYVNWHSQNKSSCQCFNQSDHNRCQTIQSKNNFTFCQPRAHPLCLCTGPQEDSLFIQIEDASKDHDGLYTCNASMKSISMFDNTDIILVRSEMRISVANDDLNCLDSMEDKVVFAPDDLRCLNLTISAQASPLKPTVFIRKTDGGTTLPLCNQMNKRKKVMRSDAGEYSVECKTRIGTRLNLIGTKKRTIKVEVDSKPEIFQFEIQAENIENDTIEGKEVYFLEYGQTEKVQLFCNLSSSPKPEKTFSFKSCIDQKTDLLEKSEDEVRPCGVYSCEANNTFGRDKKEIYFAQREANSVNRKNTTNNHLGLFHRAFVKQERSNDEQIVQHDEVVIVCRGSLIFNNLSNVTLRWKINNKTVGLSKRRGNQIEANLTVTVQSGSKYFCIAGNDEYELVLETVRFEKNCENLEGMCRTVGSQKQLRFQENGVSSFKEDLITYAGKANLRETIKKENPLSLGCRIEGQPRPEIAWLFQGKEVDTSRVSLHDGGSYLIIKETNHMDQGNYTCIGSVKRGLQRNITNISGSIFVNILDSRTSEAPMAGVIVILMVIVVGVVTVGVKQKNRMQEQLKMQIEMFQKGNMSQIDETSNLLEQAELYPYDNTLEIPYRNLEFVKQIGDGAYGKVWKAMLTETDSKTEVAVKTMNKKNNEEHLKALMSELKMLQLLGCHTNILGLVGACTERMEQREIFLVLEYCQHGSLKNYLYKNREHFVNEQCSKPQLQELSELKGYMKMRDSRYWRPFEGCGVSDRNSNLENSVRNENKSYNCQQDFLSNETARTRLSVESDKMSNNSDEMEKDGKIFTTNLYIWSIHISKGMEYLTSKNLLHGDLALRNVLLTGDKIAKICDFGLSRSLYTKSEYVKKSDSPLPLKWMAIESIENGVFSHKSDVWAFGVTLWELWELAKNPYFHHQANEEFITKLHEGFRLYKPHLASSEMYELLKSCWQKCPSQRPSFPKITKLLESTIETFEKLKFQQFLPKHQKAEEIGKMDQKVKDSSDVPSSPYIEMKLRPKTTDSYIRLSNNGYKVCLLEDQKEDENDNIQDGVFIQS